MENQDQTMENGVDDGLQLVHLLLACAEALGCRDTQLAETILSQIWSPTMETVAAESDALGIELKFHLITGPATPEMLTKDNLHLKEGETLFVNSILHLHTYVKESRGSVKNNTPVVVGTEVMKGSRCGDGYTVGNIQKGYNLLGWKGRPIMLAAAWQLTSSAKSRQIPP
ncbi:DELLA protein RGL1-like protein [Tanacetum coccineum]